MTTRRMSSRAPSADGSASISRSSARLRLPASSAANASLRSGAADWPSAGGLLEADLRREAVGGEAPGHPRRASAARRRRRRGREGSWRSGTAASARVGSSSSARRSDSSSPSATRPSASDGSSESRNCVDRLRRLGADELRDHLAVAERLHRRDALDPERARDRGVGVDVELDQLDLARAGLGGALEHRSELAAWAAPLGPEVDHDRQLSQSAGLPLIQTLPR